MLKNHTLYLGTYLISVQSTKRSCRSEKNFYYPIKGKCKLYEFQLKKGIANDYNPLFTLLYNINLFSSS